MKITGTETLAQMFGVAQKTIIEWQDEGMPIARRGSAGIPSEFDSTACINWYVDRECRKVQGETPSDRLSRVKADQIEMENMERRKQLIPVAEIEPKLRAAIVTAREAWQEEPARLARLVAGTSDMEEIERLLTAPFEAFLHRIANWRNATATEEGDDDE